MRTGVVVAARNASRWIADAVVSVRAQTHRDWRLAVVDDGSTDDTAHQTAEAAGGDSRIAVIRQRPMGVSAARNRGACAVADADALLFLDADDWLAAHALRSLSELLLSAPQSVAASGTCAFVHEHDGPGSWPRQLLYPRSGDLLDDSLLKRNMFANCGQVLLRAAAVRAAGGFRPELAFGEDWEFLVRVAVCGRFRAMPPSDMPTLFVRRRPAGAFLSQAARPHASKDCMDAIFGHPALVARFGSDRLRRLRARAETEQMWTRGRALLAQGRRMEGCATLWRSLPGRPSMRRLTFALAATAVPGLGALA